MLLRYLLTWLAIPISRFTRSFSYPLLRCYKLPSYNLLSICRSRFTRSFSYPLLRCYAVSHRLPETWLSICISHFTRSFLYPMFRRYDVTLLHITFLRHGCRSVKVVNFTRSFLYQMLRCYDVTLLRCYAVTISCYTDIAYLLTLSPPCVGTHGYSPIRP